MSKFSGWIFGASAFLLPLILYVITLSPTYIPIDSPEFALCMHFWGICHPPGFPLYVLLGKFFTAIFPIGTIIYKANLFSAIFGAGTILLVFLALKELRVKSELAFLLAIFLAVNKVFWEFSVSADVFTFATFLIALTSFLTFKKKFLLAVFALGLSASHFYISVVLLPVIYWYFLGFRLHIKSVLLSGAVFLLGFFPQILLFLRMQQSPEINWGHAEGISGYIDFVRRKEFGSIFLIANPVLTFSIFKVLKHFFAYFASLFVNFGFILPILGLVGAIWGLKDKKFVFLLFSFLILLSIQLFLLGTIDPLDKTSNFQVNKFYLSSFTIAILLIGYSVSNLIQKFFEDNDYLAYLILGLLVVIYLFANFKQNDFSQNYLNANFNLDALEQLPEESVAITLSHTFYFGGLYEQKINNQFESVSLLYFPNDKNRDVEKYQPQLFAGSVDMEFVDEVESGFNLGKAEKYILETIARNLDKDIYILQGTFEEKFFRYLAPNLSPHGLWWKFEVDRDFEMSIDKSIKLFSELRNDGITVEGLHLKQQKDDLIAYAVSYHSTAIELGKLGKYDEAIEFMEKSLAIDQQAESVINAIELLRKTKDLEFRFNELVAQGNKSLLLELGNNQFVLKNYDRCGQVYQAVLEITANDAKVLSNLASCLASAGNSEEARVNYQRALELDPDLEIAKKGLGALEN